MRTTAFVAFVKRIFGNQQHKSDKRGARKMEMKNWAHKLMRGAAALSLGLAVCEFGTRAHAAGFAGSTITPKDVAGIDIHSGETNFIVDVALCLTQEEQKNEKARDPQWKPRTYLHVQTDHPFHDRVFATWNIAALNGNNMYVWGQCYADNVHADLHILSVAQ